MSIEKTVDRSKIGRNNKSRSKNMERQVAKIVSGKRHLADTGGLEDVEHPDFSIQVKSGIKLVNKTLKGGLDAVKVHVETTKSGKLPMLVAVDRDSKKLRYFAIFELESFIAAWKAKNEGNYGMTKETIESFRQLYENSLQKGVAPKWKKPKN